MYLNLYVYAEHFFQMYPLSISGIPRMSSFVSVHPNVQGLFFIFFCVYNSVFVCFTDEAGEMVLFACEIGSCSAVSGGGHTQQD